VFGTHVGKVCLSHLGLPDTISVKGYEISCVRYDQRKDVELVFLLRFLRSCVGGMVAFSVSKTIGGKGSSPGRSSLLFLLVKYCLYSCYLVSPIVVYLTSCALIAHKGIHLIHLCQTINYINLQATTARRSAFLLFHNLQDQTVCFMHSNVAYAISCMPHAVEGPVRKGDRDSRAARFAPLLTLPVQHNSFKRTSSKRPALDHSSGFCKLYKQHKSDGKYIFISCQLTESHGCIHVIRN
jgi:hypothetical protein